MKSFLLPYAEAVASHRLAIQAGHIAMLRAVDLDQLELIVIKTAAVS